MFTVRAGIFIIVVVHCVLSFPANVSFKTDCKQLSIYYLGGVKEFLGGVKKSLLGGVTLSLDFKFPNTDLFTADENSATTGFFSVADNLLF